MRELAQITAANYINDYQLVFDVETNSGGLQIAFDSRNYQVFSANLDCLCDAIGKPFDFTEPKHFCHKPFIVERGLNGEFMLYRLIVSDLPS